MSFKNRLRNIQMFGLGRGKSKHTQKLIIGVILVILFVGIGKFFISNENNEITGQTITIDQSQEQIQGQALVNEKLEPIEYIEEEIPKEENDLGYETYEYYEYGGECSYDIKKAEDDVNDILTYKVQNEEKHKTLKDEYNNKLQELKNNYEIAIQIAGEKVEEDQIDLIKAQEELQQVQEVCSF